MRHMASTSVSRALESLHYNENLNVDAGIRILAHHANNGTIGYVRPMHCTDGLEMMYDEEEKCRWGWQGPLYSQIDLTAE
jgi:hypothetical protein